MALTVNLKVGRLLSRNEKLNTAKFNAVVKGIVIDLTGLIGSADIAPGAVNAAATSADAFWYALATSSGGTYTAAYANAVNAYVDGMWLSFKTDAACLQAPKFDAGAGAVTIVKWGGYAIGPGELPANSIITVRYNSTLIPGGCWEALSPIQNDPMRDDFAKASATMGGERGLVPAPRAGQQNYVLFATGWADPTATIAAIVQAQQSSAINLAQFLLSQH